ncbi:MAG: F0F1 ATP synthase subunit alpha [Armatimonadetes bacterium]|nr:F0F1 ATP synthase subunit alpha [Armatimonadota bacterium]
MQLRPEEITVVLKNKIEAYEPQLEQSNMGTVIQVGDNIARIYGLTGAKTGEILEFPHDIRGIVFNLEEDSLSAVILGSDVLIKEGDTVKCTGKVMEVPVGQALVGRVVNSLGQPLDGKGPIVTERTRPLESLSPSVVDRQPVGQPLQTGLKAIDALIPIGRGQRELIIGDRQTGKTAIAVDTIINQRGLDVICIYVAVGQKISTVASVVDTLRRHDAMEYTIVVTANSNEPPSLLYLAPYAGCAMGEEFMYGGKDVLIIYDDLSKHAKAYREISLLLRRPPGREAFPGDVFYLHSRLLERGAKLNDEQGGGSMTSLPIIETQAGDVSAYIPTNVISITDGQIYLDTALFYQGIRPAVDVGLSVSRVGGAAQIKAMKQVAGPLRLDLAQYRDLAAFAKFSSDLDKATRDQLARGERVVAVLRQDQFVPLPVESQVMILYAVTNGYLDDIEVSEIRRFEEEFLRFMKNTHPEIGKALKEKKELDVNGYRSLEGAVSEFKSFFAASREARVA